ncbi:Hypothetical protein CINCED_3A020346 [Cinara cedri]|nr:Hypothetical protein CINCED_3A020346 [Cinara cedri]
MRLLTVEIASILVVQILVLFAPQNHACILKAVLRLLQNSVISNHLLSDNDVKSLMTTDDTMDIRYWNSKLGKTKSIKINYGQEAELNNYWMFNSPLKVIIHGWLDSTRHKDGVFCIKAAYIDLGGYNVISVDWGSISSNRIYMLPVLMTPKIGNLLARIIDNIIDLGLAKLEDIHLIGHSLGAHIAGVCGSSITSGKIYRITGLDPAGPGYEYARFQRNGLKKTDAKFVDVIHTSAGSTGMFSSIGHSDFFPNGGVPPQPGCFEGDVNLLKLIGVVGCSHSRAYELYEDSLYNRFSLLGIKCDSWQEYMRNMCKENPLMPVGHDATSE